MLPSHYRLAALIAFYALVGPTACFAESTAGCDGKFSALAESRPAPAPAAQPPGEQTIFISKKGYQKTNVKARDGSVLTYFEAVLEPASNAPRDIKTLHSYLRFTGRTIVAAEERDPAGKILRDYSGENLGRIFLPASALENDESANAAWREATKQFSQGESLPDSADPSLRALAEAIERKQGVRYFPLSPREGAGTAGVALSPDGIGLRVEEADLPLLIHELTHLTTDRKEAPAKMNAVWAGRQMKVTYRGKGNGFSNLEALYGRGHRADEIEARIRELAYLKAKLPDLTVNGVNLAEYVRKNLGAFLNLEKEQMRFALKLDKKKWVSTFGEDGISFSGAGLDFELTIPVHKGYVDSDDARQAYLEEVFRRRYRTLETFERHLGEPKGWLSGLKRWYERSSAP